MELRRACAGDLDAEFDVYVAAQGALAQRRGSDWVAPEGDRRRHWVEIHRHLLEHDGQRAFVAEQDGRLLGFTAALVRGGCWFLSALFVDPACQGHGAGRKLLELAWNGAHERKITITDALQPVSNGLYATRGLLPVVPILTFSGKPNVARDHPLKQTGPNRAELRSLDLAAYRFDRAVDHAFWDETSSESTVWKRNGEPVAYSYRSPLGIGPLAGRDPESARLALRAELARSEETVVNLLIPGSATTLVEEAVAAGLRFGDPGLLLLWPPGDMPPTTVAIHSYWLY